MKHRQIPAASLFLLICAVAIADPAPAPPAKPAAAPPSAAPTPPSPPVSGVHFSHADHAKLKVAVDKCEACHAVDAKGQVTPPAALGHAPCLSSGCHANDFLAVSVTVQKANPASYAKATAFCLGCHDSKDGAPPAPWVKPGTGVVLKSFQNEREYHVEMPHFAHVQLTQSDCRACHVVDDKTFTLVSTAPGHAQCVGCHAKGGKLQTSFTMSACGKCHSMPSRADYFQGSRPKVDVRACGSEGEAAFAARGKRSEGCFRHERSEHRTLNGVPVQCGACHSMVADQHNGKSYKTLLDLHTEPVIDSTEREHQSCGGSKSCHQQDVKLGGSKPRCLLCHADKSGF